MNHFIQLSNKPWRFLLLFVVFASCGNSNSQAEKVAQSHFDSKTNVKVYKLDLSDSTGTNKIMYSLSKLTGDDTYSVVYNDNYASFIDTKAGNVKLTKTKSKPLTYSFKQKVETLSGEMTNTGTITVYGADSVVSHAKTLLAEITAKWIRVFDLPQPIIDSIKNNNYKKTKFFISKEVK